MGQQEASSQISLLHDVSKAPKKSLKYEILTNFSKFIRFKRFDDSV